MNALLALLDVVALVGGTVHTQAPDAPEPAPATVLIEDGRITAVGPEVEVPDGAQEIDVTGLHVLPGLVDAVVTFEAEHDVLYLSAGVTLVRDHGSPFGTVLPEKMAELRDRNPGPALLATGPLLGGLAAERADAVALSNAEATAGWLARFGQVLSARGMSFDAFAVDASIESPVLRTISAAARKASVEVWGPRPRGMDWAAAREAGQRGLLGLDTILPEGVDWGQEGEFPDLSDTVAELAAGGWSVAPLLKGTARVLRTTEDYDESLLGLLSPTLELAWLADRNLFTALQAGQRDRWQRALDRQRAFVLELHRAGVPLVPASGAPSPWILPGEGLVDELEEWSAAGISNEDILRLATRSAAASLGAGAERGTLEKGRVADLVVAGSDPRLGPAALRDPELVVVRGRVLERFDLEDMRGALREQQNEVRAVLSQAPDLDLPPMPDGELVLAGSADSVAFGRRLTTERFAVSRLADGSMAYGVRASVPPTASEEGRELVLVQRIRDGLVQSFKLELRNASTPGNAPADFQALGVLQGEGRRLTIERTFRGQATVRDSATEPVALIDVATTLSGLIVGRHFEPGASFVVSFEGAAMEPAVDRWRMRVREPDHRLDVLTSRGFLVWALESDGVPRVGIRKQGEGHLELENITADVRGGNAFGLAAERVFDPDAVEVEGDDGGEQEGRED